MQLIKPSFEIELITDPKLIEKAGRTCYKTEDKITEYSLEKFLKMIIKRGHESVIEHSLMIIRFIVDRGVTHEEVRHRLCAFSQESTRYCDYSHSGEIDVIIPFFFNPMEETQIIKVPVLYERSKDDHFNFKQFKLFAMNSFDVWFLTCLWTEWGYMTLRNVFGRRAEEARTVLPNSLKTEIVVSCNFREWRHIFKLRSSLNAHPQMQEIMRPLLDKCKELIPVIFDDITY
jgi:thymidylate synthase (FAD)